VPWFSEGCRQVWRKPGCTQAVGVDGPQTKSMERVCTSIAKLQLFLVVALVWVMCLIRNRAPEALIVVVTLAHLPLFSNVSTRLFQQSKKRYFSKFLTTNMKRTTSRT
jgi:hypothetical protein